MTETYFDLWENLSGLDFLRSKIASGEASPMDETLGLHVREVGDGYAVVESTPKLEFLNTMRRIHGGFVASLLDAALGASVMTKMSKGVGFGTVDLKVTYVRRIDVTTGPLLCRATVLHAGRTMLTTEAKVADTSGVLYAHGSGTFLVYPK